MTSKQSQTTSLMARLRARRNRRRRLIHVVVLAGTLVATGFGFLAIAGLRAAGRLSEEPDPGAERRQASPGLEIGLALAGGAVAVAAISRAGSLIDYATSHTGPTFVAFGLAGVCAALLTALSAAAEE